MCGSKIELEMYLLQKSMIAQKLKMIESMYKKKQ